jgi:preprotein translocase subunit SecD
MRLASIAVFAIACSSPSRAPVVANQVTAKPPTPVASPSRGLEFKVVDEDAPFMRVIFAHVGMEKDGKPTDPLAISTGVAADIDAWSEEATGTMHRDYYLKARDRATLESYLTRLASTDQRFVVPSDREWGFEKVKDGEWRSYYLEKAVSLDGSMVKEAVSSVDPNIGRPVVLLDFDLAGTRRLAEVTKRIVGKKLAIILDIILDGTIRSAPIINGEIAGGRASITMGGDNPAQQQQDADRLVDTFKRK